MSNESLKIAAIVALLAGCFGLAYYMDPPGLSDEERANTACGRDRSLGVDYTYHSYGRRDYFETQCVDENGNRYVVVTS